MRRKNVFIQGNNIYLRPLQEDDLLGNYGFWFNDAEVTNHMIKGAFPTTVANLQQYYASVVTASNHLVLAVVDENTEEHIGNIGLHDIQFQHQSAELGICIGEKRFWGQGVGSEAVRLICNHGFQLMNLRRIELGVLSSHAGAIRSYQAVGFKQEGIRRKAIYKNGTFVDVIIMGLLKEEFSV